jgi:hypothetical protein
VKTPYLVITGVFLFVALLIFLTKPAGWRGELHYPIR